MPVTSTAETVRRCVMLALAAFGMLAHARPLPAAIVAGAALGALLDDLLGGSPSGATVAGATVLAIFKPFMTGMVASMLCACLDRYCPRHRRLVVPVRVACAVAALGLGWVLVVRAVPRLGGCAGGGAAVRWLCAPATAAFAYALVVLPCVWVAGRCERRPAPSAVAAVVLSDEEGVAV